MHVIGLDLGGTKLAAAIFNEQGEILHRSLVALEQRRGQEVTNLITSQISGLMAFSHKKGMKISGIGICVPGIYYQNGTVWAPNIPGWEAYPLLKELNKILRLKSIRVKIDSDRAGYILGESWRGAARGCHDVIFLAIGTGIGAGILINGSVLRGAHDIAGAIGWMALQRPFHEKYQSCGCFEYQASGAGMARMTREFLAASGERPDFWRKFSSEEISARDVFSAFELGDPIAKRVIQNCIQLWGMSVANLVSLFNPEKIILGGGVFGPAARFLSEIRKEARLWAQPISIRQVRLEVSALGADAGLYGAGRLALI